MCTTIFLRMSKYTYRDKLGLSSAKLSRDKFGCLEVIFEVVPKDNLK